MRLDLFIKLILCVTYFVTLLTMSDPQSSDMRHIRQSMSVLLLATDRLSKL